MPFLESARELYAELRDAWNPQFLRVLVARKRGLAPGARIPHLARRADGIAVDRERLRRYRAVCGYTPGTRELPLCYPQVLAFPLQLELMLDPAFPLPLLGLIHLRIAIEQRRAIEPGERLSLECATGEERETERGLEVELETRVLAGGELRWQSTTTILRKRRRQEREQRRRERRPLLEGAEELRIPAPAETGRRYALCSGDLNPIHLHPWSARPFGFRSAIAHGMWSLARSLAALEPAGIRLGDGVRLRCDFKLPVLLPATLTLRWRRDGAVTELGLLSLDGERPHLTAELAPNLAGPGPGGES